MEAIGYPNAYFPPEGGHEFESLEGRGKYFRAIEQSRPDEDLRKVACGARVKTFAKVGESSDLCSCSFCEGKAFGEVLVCRVVVL